MTEMAPAEVGPYTPQQLLATGSQSQVWLASGPGGEVALKIARTHAHRRALMREIEVLSLGGHPHLARLLDRAEDGSWLALERIHGATMDQWAQERTVDDVIAVGLQLVEALRYLHEHGIVHGDVKPSNVLVDGQRHARLLDLGIASVPGERVEGFRGTLGYAAPELLRSEAPSPATDYYGLGAVLYACLAGRTPFVAPDPAALTYLPLVSLPPPPAAFRPEIPSVLNQLLLALLARDARRRPTSPDKVRETLRAALGGKPAPPVLGMLEEREELRRAVVGAADGEPRVVVLYGPPGSGRRTLISEAVEYARREGLPYLKGSDPKGALASLRSAGRPSVLVMRAAHKGGRQLAQLVLKEGLRCLFLLHADRPVPQLDGAIHLTPAPLTELDAVRLARMYAADTGLADGWWRASFGLPIGVLGQIRAWRRAQGLTDAGPASLPSESRRILEALRAHNGRRQVSLLAQELSLPEHTLLDHCEVLFAEDLIEPADDGLSLKIVRSRSVR